VPDPALPPILQSFGEDLAHAMAEAAGRSTYAQSAAGLSLPSSARPATGERNTRVGLRRMALAVDGLAGVVVTVATLLLVGFGSDTPRAFAGWSATPTASGANQLRRAREGCLPGLPTSTGTGGVRYLRRPGMPYIPAGGWHIVLTDTRGPYTEILFVAARGAAELSCFTGRLPRSGGLGGSFASRSPRPVPAGQVTVVSSGGRTTPPVEGSRQFSELVGRTGPGVTGVTLTLRDGTRVAATVANGWFLAWWPGPQGGTGMHVTTSKGTARQR